MKFVYEWASKLKVDGLEQLGFLFSTAPLEGVSRSGKSVGNKVTLLLNGCLLDRQAPSARTAKGEPLYVLEQHGIFFCT